MNKIYLKVKNFAKFLKEKRKESKIMIYCINKTLKFPSDLLISHLINKFLNNNIC